MISRSKIIAIIVLCSLAAMMLPLAAAQTTDPTPQTTDESFTIYTVPNVCQVGDTINIFAIANSIDPGNNITITDVTVYDPSGTVATEMHGLNVVMQNTTTPVFVGSVTATVEGQYTVQAGGWGCPTWLRALIQFFCYHRYNNSVPEVPIGTIAATLSIGAATGIYIIKKRKNNK